MKRDKIEDLFNKNHIRLTKTTLYDPSKILSKDSGFISIFSSSSGIDSRYYWEKKNNNVKNNPEKCKSPLGFYYWKIRKDEFENNSMTIKEIHIENYDIKYCLTYVSEFHGVQIGNETRPWMLVEGDKSIEDHFIFDLLELLNDLFMYAEEKKITAYKGSKWEPKHIETSIKSIKDEVFVDLFGSKDGIKFQTNDEKILSHGFDLKTSFRKM